MTTWTVTIEASAPDDMADDRVAPDRIADFGRVLREHVTEASTDGVEGRYRASLGMDGADVDEIVHAGVTAFRTAQDRVELPDWPIVRCEMLTADEIESRRIRQTEPVLMGAVEVGDYLGLPLVGARETSQLLGVSRQRLSQLSGRDDFPRPIAQLAATPVWLTSAVEVYARNRRRSPGRIPAGWKAETSGRIRTDAPYPAGQPRPQRSS